MKRRSFKLATAFFTRIWHLIRSFLPSFRSSQSHTPPLSANQHYQPSSKAKHIDEKPPKYFQSPERPLEKVPRLGSHLLPFVLFSATAVGKRTTSAARFRTQCARCARLNRRASIRGEACAGGSPPLLAYLPCLAFGHADGLSH